MTISGLFAGPEGPMIHIGALVGAGLSQFKSDSIGINIGEQTNAVFPYIWTNLKCS